MATKNEIRRTLYGMSKGAGISNDDLHTLVYGITNKEHISELTEKEFFAVRARLYEIGRGIPDPPPAPNEKSKKPAYDYGRGRLSKAQADYIWRLMYRLVSFDETPSEKTVRSRLAAVVRKVLNVNVIEDINGNRVDIFKNVTSEDASQLIEQLKRYIKSAEKKAEKRRAAGE